MWYSPGWAVIGTALVLFSIYDFYVTTVTVGGSGPLSKRLARGLWQLALWWHRRKTAHRLLSAAGPLIMLVLIATWFALCWLGWFLIFCGTESAIINAKTNAPANVIERAFYAGYTITTIGYGNFRAPNAAGQFASIMGGLNGLFLVTLAITYSIPVISASVEKRKLSLQIHSLGNSTQAVVDTGREDESFSFLTSQLQQIASSITGVSQKHLAYPVLHYFHDGDRQTVFPINLARLDDAISLILVAFPNLQASSRLQMQATQQSINNLLQTLHASFLRASKEAPRAPNCHQIELLKRAEITPEEAARAIEALPHRHLLKAFVEDDGWRWSDVHT